MSYSCEYCGKELQSQRGYEMHVAAHRNVRYKCEQCTKTYSAPTNLHRHVRMVHERKVNASENTLWSINDGGLVCGECRTIYSHSEYTDYQNHLDTHLR